MTKIKSIRSTVVCLAVLTSAMMFSQGPGRDIDARKNPNLASAQAMIMQATQKIDQAQEANRDHLGGHAEKAKDLLAQASRELKLAADASHANHPR